MKPTLLFLLLLAVLCGAACTPLPPNLNGELLVPPVRLPEGLEQAMKERFDKENPDFTMRGFSVRAYPKDTFLVAVDIEWRVPAAADQNTAENRAKKPNETVQYVAQKGYRQDGQVYWQFIEATPKDIELLKQGVK